MSEIDLKSILAREPPAKYDPKFVEEHWYEYWKSNGWFHADASSGKEKFIMMLPPPNVTGSLHIGHALTVAVEDSLSRWHRMSGREVLWLPGTDHAGIATQVRVEKHLKKTEGKSRHDLGREAFVERVFDWKNETGGAIQNQICRMGASVDWEREVFTMDDKMSKGVNAAFIKMWHDGVVFRDTRLVNWDCTLNTAVSNIEVDHIELEKSKPLSLPGLDQTVIFGRIWHFNYPLVPKNEGDEPEFIEIATTRPETMLGDTAVAIHPRDPRAESLRGRFIAHPFFPDRKIPIIEDGELVTIGKGTGAVKITPAHDPKDFMCGKRHQLESIDILNDDGTINENGGEFAGQHRFVTRVEVLKRLKGLNLFVKQLDNKMALGVCSRSGDVIEPRLKPQWFIDCRAMSTRAMAAVADGELHIHPSSFDITWQRWMENTEDWCISRQLWWGHRIPAWLVHLKGDDEGPDSLNQDHWVAADTEEAATAAACKKFDITADKILSLEQDEDVLDTWFSSALFPMSTLGWPDTEEKDFQNFFPGTLLETGGDILFFWVARMVFFSQQLTDKLPFKHIFLHPMVRDAQGVKMSKSLGNVIDPIDVMEGISLADMHEKLRVGALADKEVERAIKCQKKDFGPTKGIPECGTDAMRFALCNYLGQERNINLNIRVVISFRHFCDKLWQIVNFASLSLQDGFAPSSEEQALEPIDRWILSRLSNTLALAHNAFFNYQLHNATEALHDFWRHQLADVYLEAIKPRVKVEGTNASKVAAQNTLYTCLEAGLRALHPFMPFVTEQLWQTLPCPEARSLPSIMIAPYPRADESARVLETEEQFEWISGLAASIRATKASYNLNRKQNPPIIVKVQDPAKLKVVNKWKDSLLPLSYATEISLVDHTAPASQPGCAMQVVDETCTVFVKLEGLGLDYAAEVERLEKAQEKDKKSLAKLEKTMASKNWQKRPDNIKEKDQTSKAALQAQLDSLEQGIETFKALQTE